MFAALLVTNFLLVSPSLRAARTLIERIEKNTKLSYSSTLFNSVKIGSGGGGGGGAKTSECEICMTNAPGEIQADLREKYKPYAFRVFLGCKFASWAANKIHDVLRLSPRFYQHRFRSSDRYRDEFNGPVFERSADASLTDLNENVASFVDVLSALADSIPDDDSYDTDAFVAKTLTSLLMKTRRVQEMRKESRGDGAESDFGTARLLLADMVELQKFMSMHCSEKPGRKNNPRLYGYWTDADRRPTDEDVALVMDIVDEKFKLRPPRKENDPSGCVPKIIGPNASAEPYGDIITDIVNGATVRVSRDERSSLKRFWEHIQTHYDVDVIFEYQHLLYVAVFNLLYAKINDVYRDKESRRKIVPDFEFTYLKITQNRDRLPAYLVDGFRALSATLELLADRRNELHDEVMFENLDTRIGISELLRIFDSHVEDIACFNRVFRSVRREHDKSYVPLSKVKPALIPDRPVGTSENGCSFFKNVYSLCYRAIFLVQRFKESAEPRARETHLERFKETCDDIHKYCLVAFEKIPNVGVRKTALDIAIIVSNMPMTHVPHLKSTEVSRIFNVIMNEIDGYAVTNCTASGSDFLTFNNIDYNDVGSRHSIDESVNAFFFTNVRDFSADEFVGARERGKWFLRLRIFNRSYVFGSGVIRRFNDRISVKWKGSVQSLVEVFDYEQYLVLNPRNLYALYHLYFVYRAAVVFVQIEDVVLKRNKLRFMTKGFDDIRQDLNDNWCDLFPRQMKHLVTGMDKLLKYPRNYPPMKRSEVVTKIKKNVREIRNTFEGFDIVFRKNNKCFLTLSKVKSYNSGTDIDDRNQTPWLIDSLEPVLKIYSKLTFDPYIV